MHAHQPHIQTGTIDPVAAGKVGATVLSDGLTIHGWTIQTRKAPIVGERDIDAYRAKLNNVLSLPEQLFGHSRVTLTHAPTGLVIDFNAFDALHGWQEEGLPPLQVKVASSWQQARQQEIAMQNAVKLEWDWTFTTPYAGSLSQTDAHGYADSEPTTVAHPGHHPAPLPVNPTWDPYQGPGWEETTLQIDRGLLMERDPILFYDEVPLYESDLDDNGAVQLTVKLRVMPKCWLVLVRFWLRVDGVLVRLREARLFCRYDSPEHAHQIVREVKHFEGTFKELRAAGAPGEVGSAYGTADSTSEVFAAIAPTGMRCLKIQQLSLQPH